MAVDKTQEKLIVTAERLFADYGFDGVTIKQITQEAGQRNSSALQYHFGGKQELVRAIVAYRMPAINERRNAMLDKIEREGRDSDMRAIAEAMIYPLAEVIDSKGEGRHFVRFLAQARSNPRTRLAHSVTTNENSSVIRVGLMAGSQMKDVPSEIIHHRLTMLSGVIVGALADFERSFLLNAGEVSEYHSLSLFVSNLVDATIGMITAPVSATTLRELEAEREVNAGALADAVGQEA